MPSSGPLTKLRVTFKPYEILGIDATGHIWLKNTDTNRKEKYYIIIFTCANIRHINLELVSDTSTKSVLDALKVHSGTYGAPKIIMADNASYFKASEKLLTAELGKKNIRFHYNPVAASWYGSIFERMIGYFKVLLRRTIQRRTLSAREMHCLLKDTAMVINNRPLTAASTDIRDALPLTPNKLLFGRDLYTLAQGRHDEDVTDMTYNPDDQEILKHWRLHDALLKQVKERFNTEYLSALRERHAYDHHQGPIEQADINVGDVVIIKGQGHRMLWQLAEVTELCPGKDNQVRAVKLHTSTGETTRPINLLYPLVKNHVLQPQNEEVHSQDHAHDGQEGQGHEGQDEEIPEGADESVSPSVTGRPKRAAAQQAEEKIKAMKEFL